MRREVNRRPCRKVALAVAKKLSEGEGS